MKTDNQNVDMLGTDPFYDPFYAEFAQTMEYAGVNLERSAT
jgi:hypothetical protein